MQLKKNGQKIWIDTSQKKVSDWPVAHEEMLHVVRHTEIQIKPHRGVTTPHRMAEGIKLKRLMVPSVDEDVEQLEFSYFAGGLHKDTATLENSLAVSCK